MVAYATSLPSSMPAWQDYTVTLVPWTPALVQNRGFDIIPTHRAVRSVHADVSGSEAYQ